MDPGEFDKQIVLVRIPQTGRDRAGAPVVERQEVARPWAKVTYPGGREFLQGDGGVTTRRVVFRIYARDDIDTDVIIEFGGNDHEVQDLRPFDDVTEIHTISRAPKT